MKLLQSDYNFEITIFDSVLSALIPVSFFLMQYPFGVRTVNITFTLVMSVLCRIKYKDYSIGGPLVWYTLFLIFRSVIAVLSSDAQISRQTLILFLTMWVSGFSVTTISRRIDISIMYKVWKMLACLVCVAVIIQSFELYVLGKSVYTIKLLPASSSSAQIFDVWNSAKSRPCAFFTEPSVVIAYLAPVMFLAIQRKEYRFAIFLSFCSLMTASTTSFVALAVIWGVYVIKSDMSQRTKLLFSVFMGFAAILIFVLPIFGTATSKLILELSGESNNMFGRVYSGWLVFAHLNPVQQLFGINRLDISTYIHEHAELWSYVSQIRTENRAAYFFNTAQRVFLMTGYVGAGIYLSMLIKLIRKASKILLPYLLFVIVIMFFESNFYNSNFFAMQYTVILTLFFSAKKDACSSWLEGKRESRERL